jgi:hypothetical protein
LFGSLLDKLPDEACLFLSKGTGVNLARDEFSFFHSYKQDFLANLEDRQTQPVKQSQSQNHLNCQKMRIHLWLN